MANRDIPTSQITLYETKDADAIIAACSAQIKRPAYQYSPDKQRPYRSIMKHAVDAKQNINASKSVCLNLQGDEVACAYSALNNIYNEASNNDAKKATYKVLARQVRTNIKGPNPLQAAKQEENQDYRDFDELSL